jgi:hypothetical protein
MLFVVKPTVKMTRINLVDKKGNPTQLWENLRLYVLHNKGPMDHLYAKCYSL